MLVRIFANIFITFKMRSGKNYFIYSSFKFFFINCWLVRLICRFNFKGVFLLIDCFSKIYLQLFVKLFKLLHTLRRKKKTDLVTLLRISRHNLTTIFTWSIFLLSFNSLLLKSLLFTRNEILSNQLNENLLTVTTY